MRTPPARQGEFSPEVRRLRQDLVLRHLAEQAAEAAAVPVEPRPQGVLGPSLAQSNAEANAQRMPDGRYFAPELYEQGAVRAQQSFPG